MDNTEIVKNLKEKGWSLVGSLSKEMVDDYVNYLDECVWYGTHVKGSHEGIVGGKQDCQQACVEMHDCMLAPHWFETSLEFTPVAIDYFGTDDIVLYSYNTFFTNPGGYINQGIQEWHVDTDSANFIALFMYLTDVFSVEDGAHLFQERDGKRVEIYGAAGTMFVADTRQLHMGLKPKEGTRGLAWARWSLPHDPHTYAIDCLSPINKNLLGDRYPEDKTLQNIIRKVAA